MTDEKKNPMRRAADELREQIEHEPDEDKRWALTVALASAKAAEQKFYPA